MNVFTDTDYLPDFKNAVITIGSFDGVHEGHRKIIDKVVHIARQTEGESVLITFHPHPRQIVFPQDDPVKILSTTLEKIHLLSSTGLDNLVIVSFTVEMSQMHPDEYIESFLMRKFKPKYIVIGYDHRFGQNRLGNIDYLHWHSKRFQYQVVEIPKTDVDAVVVSSSKIRNELLKCNLPAANNLLGHPYLIAGKVIGGNKIGQSIGFPTANIEIDDKNKLILPNGIYSVYVTYDNEKYQGMLYIGNRPVVKDDDKLTIEVNIFDFSSSIYGAILAIDVIEFLRDDIAFDTLDALRTQLIKDEEHARQSLGEYEAQLAQRKNSSKSVAVVILNYNGIEHLKTFLPSVVECTPNHQIYVADNASTDKSISWVQENYPDVAIISLPQNYGFAEGYNRALQQLNEEYFVLLNSDVETTPFWLDKMMELTADPEVAAVQPKILSYKDKTSFEYAGASGGFVDALFYPFCRGRMFLTIEKDEGQYNNKREIFWASGACMLVNADLFRKLGGFDKDYFAHFEEIDFCWRLHKAGYKVMVNPEAVVYHLGGGTLNYDSSHKTYLNFRNSLYTISKNEFLLNLIWVLPFRVLTDLLFVIYRLLTGKINHSLAILKAYVFFIFNIPALFYKRMQYNEKIDSIKLDDAPNTDGVFHGSILWTYFAMNRKTFRKL